MSSKHQGEITQGKIAQIGMTLKLSNARNSCFVNTCLQLLYTIPEVRDLFTGLPGTPAEYPVAWELGRLMREAGRVNTACRLRYLVAHSTIDLNSRLSFGQLAADASSFLNLR